MKKLSFIEALICVNYHIPSLQGIQTFERFFSARRTLPLQQSHLILSSDF
jgi:hypothetical protein